MTPGQLPARWTTKNMKMKNETNGKTWRGIMLGGRFRREN